MTINFGSALRGTRYRQIPGVHINWRGDSLMNFLSAKGEVLDNLTDTQFAADLSTLDAQGIALNILSVNLAPKPLEKCQFYAFFGILIV
jgi:hypothetical protein